MFRGAVLMPDFPLDTWDISNVTDGTEFLAFEVTGGTTPIAFSTTATDAASDPKGDFALIGTSLVSGAFKYDLSFDKTKNNYITKVLGRGAQDGKTAVFVEEIFSEMFNDYNLQN